MVEFPVLRDAFDPWRSKDHDENDGCEGCKKMDESKLMSSSHDSLPMLETDSKHKFISFSLSPLLFLLLSFPYSILGISSRTIIALSLSLSLTGDGRCHSCWGDAPLLILKVVEIS